MWEAQPSLATRQGPFGRAPAAVAGLGWSPLEGTWWVWEAPGQFERLCLATDRWPWILHCLREALRRKALVGLEKRRPRQFGGMGGAVDREGVRLSLEAMPDATHRGYLRGIVAGALWTAQRAADRRLAETAVCPHCDGGQPEDEMHVFWHCPAWERARGAGPPLMVTESAGIEGLAGGVLCWPRCLAVAGLLPEAMVKGRARGPARILQLRLHKQMVAIVALRRLAPEAGAPLFTGTGIPKGRAYPWEQLIGPLPGGLVHCMPEVHEPEGREWKWGLGLRAQLIVWLGNLVWQEGGAGVTFVELTLDFEHHCGAPVPEEEAYGCGSQRAP